MIFLLMFGTAHAALPKKCLTTGSAAARMKLVNSPWVASPSARLSLPPEFVERNIRAALPNASFRRPAQVRGLYTFRTQLQGAEVDPAYLEILRRISLDPIARKLVGGRPLFGGSDIFKILTGFPLNQSESLGASYEVNMVFDPEMMEDYPEHIFYLLRGVEIPAWRGRARRVVDLFINGESANDVRTWAINAMAGNLMGQLSAHHANYINNTKTHLIEIPADGNPLLYFMNEEASMNFRNFELSIVASDVARISAAEWRKEIGDERRFVSAGEQTLQYALVSLSKMRGLDSRFRLSAKAEKFIVELISQLPQRSVDEAINDARKYVDHEFNPNRRSELEIFHQIVAELSANPRPSSP